MIRYFVEFGVEDGRECNTRYLYKHKHWNGLLIEGNPDLARQIHDNFGDTRVQIDSTFIKKENIVDIFKQNQVPLRFDLLSVDIDGNDYWVLKEILSDYQPRVIIVEYNAFFVHRDLLSNSILAELPPEEAYHPARYYGRNNGKYGHPYREGEHLKI